MFLLLLTPDMRKGYGCCCVTAQDALTYMFCAVLTELHPVSF